MSLEHSVSIIRDEATGAVAERMARLDPSRIAKRVLVPLREHWRDHLASMPRNTQGYPSTGFWEGAARSIERDSYAAGSLIVLRGSGPPGRPGLRQRYYGGAIEAANHANISIPMCAESYGTTVKDWGYENLTLVILADGRKFFALYMGTQGAEKAWSKISASRKGSNKSHGAETSIRRAQSYGSSFKQHPKVIIFRGGGSGSGPKPGSPELKFLFVLVPKTKDQAPNPNVIPPDMGEFTAQVITDAITTQE